MPLNAVVRIPDGFSEISAGAVLPDGTLISGHKNGYVVLWQPHRREPQIILRTSSEVHDIALTSRGEVLVGCNAGDLYRLSSPTGSSTRILPPTNTKHTRVFRVMEPEPGEILCTSTYGVIRVLRHEGSTWYSRQLPGHTDAVFAVAKSPNGTIATGDYYGMIRLWRRSDESYSHVAKLTIPSYVSGLSFLGDDLLAAVGKNGGVYLLERQASRSAWRSVFENETASAQGRTIATSSDPARIVAVTKRELIEINPATQEVRSAPLSGGGVKLFLTADAALVVTAHGLTRVPWSEFKPKVDVVEYEYLKVSLLGNTGYGKTTLASALATGGVSHHESTFGRRVWSWSVSSEAVPRRVLLNDNGGQEQVVGTLLPLSADSDAVLYFFKQTELAGLTRAIELHDRMQQLVSPGTKSFLVETYVDHELKAVTDERVRRALSMSGFDDWFKVVPTDPRQVDEFKQEFQQHLDWTQSRKAVQSKALSGLSELVEALKAEGTTVLSLGEVKSRFEEHTGEPIYLYHLKFLLKRLTDSGVVEFYPEVADTVVLDDPIFNRLRTDIPILARDYGGMVNWRRIESKYPEHSGYVAMLDQYYITNRISLDPIIDNFRLFPAFLEYRQLRIENLPPELLGAGGIETRTFGTREIQISNLLQALFDAKLEPHDITANEGVLGWGSNAFLYYRLTSSHGALEGPELTVRYKAAGPNTEIVARLKRAFEGIIESLYESGSLSHGG